METTTDKIVTIARFPNNRALLLQSMLQSQGIECFLAHENLLQAAVSEGVEIKVRSSDIARALKLIEEYKQDSGLQKEKSIKALKSIRRILVPVDFSDASRKAVDFALELADILKAEIKLVHVYYNPVVEVAPFDTSHMYHVNLGNYLHEIEQNARKQMADLVRMVRKEAETKSHKIKIGFSLANGIAEDEIQKIASKFHPGLIIMGSRGMGKQTEGLIGSVTARIIRKTSVPVIAIPENAHLVSIRKIRNILYATDFDEFDQVSLSRLINLLHPFSVTVHVVHVSVGVKKSWDKVKMDGLKQFMEQEFRSLPVKYKILVSDDVINSLESYMRDNAIDVMALTNHPRGMLMRMFTPSVTKKIMQRINKPLFAFKASQED